MERLQRQIEDLERQLRDAVRDSAAPRRTSDTTTERPPTAVGGVHSAGVAIGVSLAILCSPCDCDGTECVAIANCEKIWVLRSGLTCVGTRPA